MTMSSNNSRRPRVLVAEDDAVLRYAIKLILEKECEVVGEAEDGGAAVELTERLRPDVVLLDLSMPVMSGLQAGRLIRERLPDVRVIIVSNYTTEAYIDEALRMGAHGYVIKGSATFQLPEAIRDALDGKLFRPA